MKNANSEINVVLCAGMQCSDRNRNRKRLQVYTADIQVVKSNVSSVDPSSERNIKISSHASL